MASRNGGASELAYQGILCTPGYDLGGRARLTGARPKHRLLQLSAKSEQDPLTVAISLDLKTAVAPVLGSSYLVRGTCLWGSKSGQQLVTFDVRHGTRMTLDASHVTLDAELIVLAGTAPEFDLHSSITYGSVSGPSSLTLTEPRFVLASGTTSARFQIPSYARKVAVFTSSTGTYFASLYTSANPAAGLVQRIPCTGAMDPVLLPDGVEFLDVTFSGGGAANTTFTIVYELVI
jgi:hypothetical protein